MRTRRRQPATRPGVVMIITLFALVLLTALVLFVLNTGDQVNRRQQTQDTADATAIAGATYIARGLNVVAQNNIAITFKIATINTLDSMPEATDFALREQTAFHTALRAQLSRGLTNQGDPLRREITQLMEDFEQELQDELDQIEPVHEFYQGFDVTEMTYYNAPQGRGNIWKAMMALDELSQVILENLGEQAQTMAVQAGEHASPHRQTVETFMAPLEPRVPWQRGGFNDLEYPVKFGVLPPDIDDVETRRGPYDTVFGWHRRVSRCINGYHSDGNRHVAQGGRGGIPIGRGSGGQGAGRRWHCTESEVYGYRTWGTHEHQLDRVSNFVRHNLRNTRLDWWTRRMADFKLNYLWPGNITGGEPDDDPHDNTDPERTPDASYPPLREIVDPDWVMGYDEAMQIAATRRQDIKETGYFRLEIKSKYPRTDPNFMAEGTWAPAIDHGGVHRWQPQIVRMRGWVNPVNWEQRPTVAKVANHGWMDEWDYEVFFDNEIGIEPIYDADGQLVPQPAYRIDHFWFAGVNVGEEIEVPNCFEGFDRGGDDAPSPVSISIDVTDTEASRRQYLTFLAITRHDDTARAWRRGFWSRKPGKHMVAVAQAKVFNTHSWEAWTPMWNASLEPVTGWDDWRTRIAESGTHGEVAPDMIDFTANYFDRTAGLADTLLRH